MKSVQTKFIILILSRILVCSTVVGGAGILGVQRVVDEDAAQLTNLRYSESAEQIDVLLSRIERSMKTLTVYTDEHLGSAERLKHDDVYLEEFTEQLESVTVNAVNDMEGAVATYVRYNPEFTPSTSGLFQSRTDLNGGFRRLTPTDFSRYNLSDTERVGWYCTPVENGKATWTAPYDNKNINLRMISYVIPVYKRNETMDVAGVDVNFTIIEDLVSGLRIYEGGYVFLTDDKGNAMYRDSYPFDIPVSNMDESLYPLVVELENGTNSSNLFSYLNEGTEEEMAFRALRSGMRLAVAAPVMEIGKSKSLLLIRILASLLVIIPLALMVTVVITRRMIKPLEELNIVTKRIAEDDLSVSLTTQTKDEVGALTDSPQQTVNHLQKCINYINNLAYRDALTGVKNKAAFQEAEQRLEGQMRRGRPEFATVVLDINNLKFVSGHFDHDLGDMLIMGVCRIICKSFTHSPVYHAGGDEFVVILEGADYTNCVQLFGNFQQAAVECNENNKGNILTIARGIAIYDSGTDLVFSSAFKHADDAVYQNKVDMKRKELEAREKRE